MSREDGFRDHGLCGLCSSAPCRCTKPACSHERTIRGADIPRRWGSYRSQVCLDCLAFRQLDHYNKPRGEWRPASEYEGAIANEEDA